MHNARKFGEAMDNTMSTKLTKIVHNNNYVASYNCVCMCVESMVSAITKDL